MALVLVPVEAAIASDLCPLPVALAVLAGPLAESVAVAAALAVPDPERSAP